MPETNVFLTHTADVRLRVTADTLPKLFELSLNSLNQLLVAHFNGDDFKATITEHIDLKSADTTSLLVDFLSEVLTLSHVHKAIFIDFEIEKMSDRTLSATLYGRGIDAFEKDVKAVTYHEADVKVNDEGDWETIIIFDI